MIELEATLDISEDLEATLSTEDNQLRASLDDAIVAGVTSWNGQTGDVVYLPPTVLTPLVGSADDITPTMVLNAIQGGRDVLITFTDEDYGVNKINYFQYIDQLNAVASCIAFENQSVQFIGTLDDNVWNIEPVRLAFNSDIPTKTSQLQNDSGYLTSAVTSFNGSTGAVTYSAPVSSVNGQTGAVSIDVGVTSFNGSTGAITYTAPVTSVNGSTGDVTGLQTTANLVTALSNASTDSQYPSAKCVYDAIGDIETLLSAI